MKRWQACLLLVCSVACDEEAKCGGDDGDSCGEMNHDAGSEPQLTKSLLGASPASYNESSEAANGSEKSAEATGYTLETANGIAIRGAFEASAPTADSYRFNAGALGKAGKPGFPGVDIMLVVDGDRTQRNAPLSLSLDTVAEKGYSSLLAGNYFLNAALITGEEYVITVSPGTAGKSYTLELRGRAP